MTHALVRGKRKVETEYRITAILYNLIRSASILGPIELKERLRSLLAAILAVIRLVLSLRRGILSRDSVTFYPLPQ